MNRNQAKRSRRLRRKVGIRKRVNGTAERPRLSVYRSLRHTYAQLVDDLEGRTIAAASTVDKGYSGQSTGDTAAAAAVGKLLAERATSKGVKAVVFDRGGFRYHGRVKALADAARQGGLEF